MKKLSKSLFLLLLLALAQPVDICAGDAEARSEDRGRKERIERGMKLVRTLQNYTEVIDLKEDDFSTPKKFLDALKEKYPKLYTEMKKLQDTDRERFRKTMFVIRRIVLDGKEGIKNVEAREDFRKTFKQHEEKREALRKEMKTLVEKYNSSETGKEKLLKAIHEKAATAFDMTTRTRKMLLDESERKLDEAKKRLATAREQLESREKNRDNYIDDFVDKIKDGTVPEELLDSPESPTRKKTGNQLK